MFLEKRLANMEAMRDEAGTLLLKRDNDFKDLHEMVDRDFEKFLKK